MGAGIDTFWMLQLPAPVQVVMALRLSGLPEDIPGDHHFKNIIRAPDGTSLAEQEGTLAFEGAQHVERPDYLQGIMLQTVVLFEAAEEGTYSVEFILDKSSTYAVPLHVVHGPPPGVDLPE